MAVIQWPCLNNTETLPTKDNGGEGRRTGKEGKKVHMYHNQSTTISSAKTGRKSRRNTIIILYRKAINNAEQNRQVIRVCVCATTKYHVDFQNPKKCTMV